MRKFFKAFVYAFQGITTFFREERNAKVHAAAAFLAICAGFLFPIKTYEWLAIIFSIGMVIIAEMINSSIEELADTVHPKQHPGIKRSKDMAAGAVLVLAIIAVIAAAIIFIPYLLLLFL